MLKNRTKEVKTDSLSLDGLDEVFDVDTTVSTEVDQPDSKVKSKAELPGLTIKQASEQYGFAVPTIRLKIKVGEIPAIKLNGPKGPEWRVFPNGVPAELSETTISLQAAYQHSDINEPEDSHQPDHSLAEGFHQANMNVAALIKANLEMTAKLESAIYRNGYLEAQLEAERSQVKLLTDSLHKMQVPQEQPVASNLQLDEPCGWWQRFGSWFLGQSKV